MSGIFVYICTRSTADPYIPTQARDLTMFARDVADGFYALQGGRQTVGKLAFFPLQQAQPDHLLCDGKEVRKDQFPELYDYLGDFIGPASDPAFFVLPNYIGGGALAGADTAAPETVAGGSVTSEPSAPGGGNSGGSEGRPVDSGGRTREVRANIE